MFTNYIKKILPIPITNIETNNDGYKYRVTTYSSVIDERGVKEVLRKRIRSNKKIKSMSDWGFKKGDTFYKQAIIEFYKKENPSE